MSTAKGTVLRKVAENELNTCWPDLLPETKQDLTTSIVRQWITNDGMAVVVTRDHHVWFRLTQLEDGQMRVGKEILEGTFTDHMRHSRIIEEQIPRLLHELTLRQSVQCETDYGQTVRLRVDPSKKMFFIEMMPDNDI